MIKLTSLLSELTQKQKDLKKDYLFSQTKLHSSNTIPTWTEMWKEIQNMDGFERNLRDIKDDCEREFREFNEKQAIEEIEDIQRHKYFDIVQSYKELNGEPCWREIVISRNVDPKTLSQIGIYWAVEKSAADSHWAARLKSEGLTCNYQAKIDFDIVDWPGTMFARMDYTLGDDEQEIRFIKNSKIFVDSVIVYGNSIKDIEKHTIEQYRRA